MLIVALTRDCALSLTLLGVLVSGGCSPATHPPDSPANPPATADQQSTHANSLVNLPGAKSVRDRMGNVVQLDLRACQFGDAEMRSLQTLDSLKVLKLSGKDGNCTVTDDGLEPISGLAHLKVLALDLLPISATGMEHLSDLNQLQELYLAKTDLDDSNPQWLGNFPNLRKLRLAGTTIGEQTARQISKLTELIDLDVSECESIGDAAAADFAKRPHLEKLNLYRTGVGDQGARSLAKCQALLWLNLDATPITDAGLVSVGKLTHLTFLHLGSTSITDEGLPHLEALINLKTLIVTRTPVSEAGVKQLKKSLPNTEIQQVYVPGK